MLEQAWVGEGGGGIPGRPLYCVNEAHAVLSSRGNTDGSQTGQGCTVGWGQGLYSSSVSWPLAEVLRVRKGHWVKGLGPTVQSSPKRWMDRASEGTRARCNATFKENTAPPHSSPVWLLRYIPGIYQCSAYSSPSLPMLGRQGLSLSVHLLLPGPVSPPPLEEGLASLTSSPYAAPAVPTIFGFISGVTGAVGTLGHDKVETDRGHGGTLGLRDTGGRTRSLPPLTANTCLKHRGQTRAIVLKWAGY